MMGHALCWPDDAGLIKLNHVAFCQHARLLTSILPDDHKYSLTGVQHCQSPYTRTDIPGRSRLSLHSISNLGDGAGEGEGTSISPQADPSVAGHRPVCIDQYHPPFCCLQAGHTNVWPVQHTICLVAEQLSTTLICCFLVWSYF